MNEQNLRPFNKMSKEEQREIAKKGKKASDKAKKVKKTFKMIFESILEKNMNMEKLSDLQAYISDTTELTAEQAMGMAITIKAVQGDLKAFELIRDIIGQKEEQKADCNVTIKFAGDTKDYSQ